jgi:hypothetical protein
MVASFSGFFLFLTLWPSRRIFVAGRVLLVQVQCLILVEEMKGFWSLGKVLTELGPYVT